MRVVVRGKYLFLGVVIAAFAAVVAQPNNVPAHAAVTDGYTSMDVGFNGTADDVNAVAAYVPGTSPFIRFDLNWWYVEDCRGCALKWDRADAVVDAAAAKGLRVLVILCYAPPWANGNHLGTQAEMTTWFPTDDADWTSIVDRTVRHFGSKVQAYEVWNEPNLRVFAKYGQNTTQEVMVRYWRMTRLADQTIHAACPTCVVLAGPSAGLHPDDQDPAREPVAWLNWAYANGYGYDFDALALHPYPDWQPDRPQCTQRWLNMFGPPGENPPCGELALVHSVMVAHGDTRKIWGTEWGYPITAPGAPSLDIVRDRIVKSLAMWRAVTYTGPLFLYRYRDVTGCPPTDVAECTFGVVTPTFAPKEPVFSTLSAAFRYVRPECVGNPTPPPAQAAAATMAPWQCWKVEWNRSMVSPDGRFQLLLQTDGNLVLYRGGLPVWATGTHDGVRLDNQIDGNLVLYRANGSAAWSSGTYGNGASVLQVRDDGSLTLTRTSDNVRTWSTHA